MIQTCRKGEKKEEKSAPEMLVERERERDTQRERERERENEPSIQSEAERKEEIKSREWEQIIYFFRE